MYTKTVNGEVKSKCEINGLNKGKCSSIAK